MDVRVVHYWRWSTNMYSCGKVGKSWTVIQADPVLSNHTDLQEVCLRDHCCGCWRTTMAPDHYASPQLSSPYLKWPGMSRLLRQAGHLTVTSAQHHRDDSSPISKNTKQNNPPLQKKRKKKTVQAKLLWIPILIPAGPSQFDFPQILPPPLETDGSVSAF